MSAAREGISDRGVLLAISTGLITILLVIVVGIYLTPRALPNWAENVLVGIGTAAALKLGDCLSTLVALSSGRSVERLGTQLSQTSPLGSGPQQVEVTNPPNRPVPTSDMPDPAFGPRPGGEHG